jgi:hypothetical protein
MNDELAEKLLVELAETRQSFVTAAEAFDKAIKQIRWNRVNTAIQYLLLFVVIIMIGFAVDYYFDDKRESCERGNELRSSIVTYSEHEAARIGIALTVVTGASEDKFEEYMEAFRSQDVPEAFQLRDC